MTDPFDPDELLMLLDLTEQHGGPPHLIEQFKELVQASTWHWGHSVSFAPSLIIQAGDSFKTGDRAIFEQDGRIYQANQPYEAGIAVRDIRLGEFVRYRRTVYANGCSYEPNPYEFG